MMGLERRGDSSSTPGSHYEEGRGFFFFIICGIIVYCTVMNLPHYSPLLLQQPWYHGVIEIRQTRQ